MEPINPLLVVLIVLFLTMCGGVIMYFVCTWMFGWDKDIDLEIEDEQLDT